MEAVQLLKAGQVRCCAAARLGADWHKAYVVRAAHRSRRCSSSTLQKLASWWAFADSFALEAFLKLGDESFSINAWWCAAGD